MIMTVPEMEALVYLSAEAVRKEVFKHLRKLASHAIKTYCYKEYVCTITEDSEGASKETWLEWKLEETSSLGSRWPEYKEPTKPASKGKKSKLTYNVAKLRSTMVWEGCSRSRSFLVWGWIVILWECCRRLVT